jgi:catechol 2,3-dioxygenase-like lactoylglutathione lyase family enzyme
LLNVGRQETERGAMRINITSVLVDDQEKSFRFYTDVLGFVKKHDVDISLMRAIAPSLKRISYAFRNGSLAVLGPPGR